MSARPGLYVFALPTLLSIIRLLKTWFVRGLARVLFLRRRLVRACPIASVTSSALRLPGFVSNTTLASSKPQVGDSSSTAATVTFVPGAPNVEDVRYPRGTRVDGHIGFSQSIRTNAYITSSPFRPSSSLSLPHPPCPPVRPTRRRPRRECRARRPAPPSGTTRRVKAGSAARRTRTDYGASVEVLTPVLTCMAMFKLRLPPSPGNGMPSIKQCFCAYVRRRDDVCRGHGPWCVWFPRPW
jgi:hypothetical protein